MRKQVAYNFNKLIGDSSNKQTEIYPDYKRQSQDKTIISNSMRSSNRMFRPVGIIRVRKDQASSSRSSINSASKQSLKITLKPATNRIIKKDVLNAQQFFQKFDENYLVKYTTTKYEHKPIKRCLLKQFKKQQLNYRSTTLDKNQYPTLKMNEFYSSRGSSSRDRLQNYKSQTKLTMQQIQNRYKQSQQKIQNIRQKVNLLYRLNTQSSQKQFRSLVMNPRSRSRPKYEHRLLI